MLVHVVIFHGDILTAVQERHALVAPAERSVLAAINMDIETFGNLVHQALKKVHLYAHECFLCTKSDSVI